MSGLRTLWPAAVPIVAISTVACGRDAGWVVHHEQRVEGLGRDTIRSAVIQVRSDSGPRGNAAHLTFLCEWPRDPTPQVMLTTDDAMQPGEYGWISVQLKLDAGPAGEETWAAPASGESAIPFRPNAKESALRPANLRAVQLVRAELPFSGGRHAFRFRTRGFDSAFHQLTQLCSP